MVVVTLVAFTRKVPVVTVEIILMVVVTDVESCDFFFLREVPITAPYHEQVSWLK